MRENVTHDGADPRRGLYAPLEPYRMHLFEMPGGHTIYVEECGNPKGAPVVILHGGPGGGCSPGMRRFFDPDHYRVILFDQRGCGRSRPHASIQENTTWHLVGDIERIRERLDIGAWAVFGGSWGATLSLLYAQKHPERVKALILRGVFLMTQEELDWFYGGAAGAFWPERWATFRDMIPEEEQGDLIAAYHARLFGPSHEEQVRFARAWVAWESGLAALDPGPVVGRGGAGEYARAFARLENHYFVNHGFLEEDRQILRDMPLIEQIPGYIVQGRYDLICPPRAAWALHQAWPGSELSLVMAAGHALSEPGITTELVGIMDRLRDR
ncbi:prolyl aminopeptidase [Paroceanicella profunda]|uniref:Proline iminopeptidase n=1 Tax=Paroceanicella profunda TaxID=2579971 RepID=A0A5B8FZ64_9RHOB|nr:prolyl aminopeptidase [Paroceanicella profunda]QDL91902.1 prolyl aminopeptidase [Paroceanicella profunda]